MRCAWVVGLVAGCGFSSTVAPLGDDATAGAGASETGSSGAGGSPGSGADPVAVSQCDVADPQLRLCLTFDSDPVVRDLSSAGHPIADSADIGKVLHDAGWAAVLSGSSHLRVADSAEFDLAQLSYEMWIAPAVAPHGGWLLDNNAQYFMSYEDNHAIRCGFSGPSVTSRTAIAALGWHHVACTYGADQTLRVYVDGDLSNCGALALPSTTGTGGIALGANFGADGFKNNFAGAIDSVHVFARALSDAEVCSAAHRTSCRTSCDESPSLTSTR
jgi:hypothetical protein